jgi:hypothetical protein
VEENKTKRIATEVKLMHVAMYRDNVKIVENMSVGTNHTGNAQGKIKFHANQRKRRCLVRPHLVVPAVIPAEAKTNRRFQRV